MPSDLGTKRAYELGQQAGKEITSQIDAHIAARIIPAGDRLTSVFKDRLATVFDEPAGPKLALYAEWEIFKGHLNKFIGEMRAEINVEAYKWDSLIERLSIRKQLDEYIAQRMQDIESNILTSAEEFIKETILKIEHKKSSI